MTQIDVIYLFLKRGRLIDNKIAFELFGCTRLGDVIYKLRKRGFQIETIIKRGHNRYGSPVRYAVYKMKNLCK